MAAIFGHVADHTLATGNNMAFRGAGEGLDREERQRLQEYEDLVDQDYDPFHEKCGKDVFLSDKKLIATRTGLSGGGVFSAKPIPLGGTFQVKLLDIGDGRLGPLVSAQSISSSSICPIHCTYSKVGAVIPNISIFYSIQSIMSKPKNAMSYLVCKDQEYR